MTLNDSDVKFVNEMLYIFKIKKEEDLNLYLLVVTKAGIKYIKELPSEAVNEYNKIRNMGYYEGIEFDIVEAVERDNWRKIKEGGA